MSEVWAAAVVTAAGAAYGAHESGKAADAQIKGNNAAVAEDRRQFDLMREDTAPYRGIGTQAIGRLGAIYGYSMPVAGYDSNALSGSAPQGVDRSSGYRLNPNGSVSQVAQVGSTAGAAGTPATGAPGTPDYSNFFASPDYQFRREQGTQGIERSLAARGLGASGNALAALADYNSGLAAGEFGNYFNRQAALAGIGQSAVNTATSAGMQSAANIGNAFANSGEARASGIANNANTWNNAAGQIGGYFTDWYRNRPPKGS